MINDLRIKLDVAITKIPNPQSKIQNPPYCFSIKLSGLFSIVSPLSPIAKTCHFNCFEEAKVCTKLGILYSRINKLSPASALRQAQLSMPKDKRWSNPYYWAGFILQGEPK